RGETCASGARGESSRPRKRPRQSPGPWGTALALLGEASWFATRYREALAYSREAADAYRDTGDRHGLATASSHSAICCWHLGRPAEAIAHLREALSLYREVGDRRGEAKTLNNLGQMQLQSGYHRDALASYH